jgi:hypothetical protein
MMSSIARKEPDGTQESPQGERIMSNRRRGIAWAVLVLLGSLLTACAGQGGSTALVTPTPTCRGATPATVISGSVKLADQVSAVVGASTPDVEVIHYTSHTRFSQLSQVAADALKPNEVAQILVHPATATSLPTADAIVVQSGTQTVEAPIGCSTPAQAGDPEIQGVITTVNRTSQLVSLVDDRGQQYLLAFSASTIIGQPEPAQQSDIGQGNLILASGTATGDGINADLVIILNTTTSS